MQLQNLPSNYKAQKGATLILALVILLVVTLVGTANMRSSSQQLSMANYDQNRQRAFKLAESALNKIEAEIQAQGHTAQYVQKNCDASSNKCFTDACTGGRCFSGLYDSTDQLADDPNECTVQAPATPPWNDGVFLNDSEHDTTKINGYPNFEDPKYIVEFLCYADASNDADSPLLCQSDALENCQPLYRFTVFASSKDGKSRVMLQSAAKLD